MSEDPTQSPGDGPEQANGATPQANEPAVNRPIKNHVLLVVALLGSLALIIYLATLGEMALYVAVGLFFLVFGAIGVKVYGSKKLGPGASMLAIFKAGILPVLGWAVVFVGFYFYAVYDQQQDEKETARSQSEMLEKFRQDRQPELDKLNQALRNTQEMNFSSFGQAGGGTAEAPFTCQDLVDRELAIYKGDPSTPEMLVERLADKAFVAERGQFLVTQCEQLSKETLAALKACQDRASTFDDTQECAKLDLMKNKPSDVKPKAVPSECPSACLEFTDHGMKWPKKMGEQFSQKNGSSVEVQSVRFCLSRCIERGLSPNWRRCLKTTTYEGFTQCLQPQ